MPGSCDFQLLNNIYSQFSILFFISLFFPSSFTFLLSKHYFLFEKSFDVNFIQIQRLENFLFIRFFFSLLLFLVCFDSPPAWKYIWFSCLFVSFFLFSFYFLHVDFLWCLFSIVFRNVYIIFRLKNSTLSFRVLCTIADVGF